jgi:hypothetical protein
MKTAENRRGDDAVALANPMARQHRRDVRAIGNARAQARVWTPAIVMRDPLPKDAAEVRLVQQNHPVQALAPNGTDHPFAERVSSGWTPDRMTKRSCVRCVLRRSDVQPRRAGRSGAYAACRS